MLPETDKTSSVCFSGCLFLCLFSHLCLLCECLCVCTVYSLQHTASHRWNCGTIFYIQGCRLHVQLEHYACLTFDITTYLQFLFSTSVSFLQPSFYVILFHCPVPCTFSGQTSRLSVLQ